MEKEDKIIQILEKSTCLKPDQLIGYLNGSLIREELRVVELHLASCKLCREAVDGMETVVNRTALINEISLPILPIRKIEVKKAIETTTLPKKAPLNTLKKSVPTPSIPKSTFSNNPHQQILRPRNYAWLGIAGIAALLLLGGYLFWQYENSAPNWPSFTINFQKKAIEQPLDTIREQSKDSIVASKAPKEISIAKKVKASPKDTLSVKDSTPTIAQANNLITPQKAAKESIVTASPNSTTNPKGSTILRKDTPDAINNSDGSNDKTAKATIAAAKASTTNGKKDGLVKESSAPSSNRTAVPAENDLNPSDYHTGFQLYQKKQYASALLYLRTAASDNQNPNHWQALYYSGLCNLAIGKTGRAKRLFKKVENANIPLSAKATEQLQNIESSGNR